MPTPLPNPTGPSRSLKKPGSTTNPGKSFAQLPKTRNQADKTTKTTKNIDNFFKPTHPLSTLHGDITSPPPPQPTNPTPSPVTGIPPSCPETIPEATIDEEMDDDATVVTGRSGGSSPPQPHLSKPNREITLKFQMQSTNPLSNQHVAICNLQLLNALANIDPDTPCIILDQYGRHMQNLGPTIAPKFEEHIPIYQLPVTTGYNKPRSYWTVFRIQTEFTLKTIRSHPSVHRVLTSTRGRLFQYHWTIQDPDTVSVCFAVGAIPHYQSAESFETLLKSTISQKCPNHRIPKFKCVISRITANSHGHASVSCDAFDIQARRMEAPKLADLLRIACPADAPLAVMFYPERYTNPTNFAGAVYIQAEHQRNHRIVAITGITRDKMFVFENKLLQEFQPKLLKILPTNLTDQPNPAGQPIGRWNLLCRREDFTDLAREMYDKLPTLYMDYIETLEETVPEGAEPITVRSRFFGKPTPDGDTTIGSNDYSVQTFSSKWTTRVAACTVEFAFPSATPTPISTTFAPVPGGSTSTNTSSISWAQVASRQGSTSIPNQYQQPPEPPPPQAPNLDHILSSLQDQLSSSLKTIQDNLNQRMDRFEDSISVNTANNRSDNQPVTPPAPPAPDPEILNQLTTMTNLMSQLFTKINDLEAEVYARKGAQQAQMEMAMDQKLAASMQQLTHMIGSHLNTLSNPSPPRKRSKSAPRHRRQQSLDTIPHMDLEPSIRPDGTPDEGEDQDEDSQHEPL
jgi:hypothetical protein